MTEEEAYEKALRELQTKELSHGLWAKAMAYSDGDEKKAESNYLRFRAEQLRENEKKERRERVTAVAGVEVSSFLTNLVPLLFSPKGKLARLRFLFVILGVAFIFALCIAIIDRAHYRNEEIVGILCLPFFLAGGWSLICAHLKRAKDAGVSSPLAPLVVFFYGALPIARFTGPSELIILHTIMIFAFLLAPSRKP
jgi:uncharacterized membrane protein YhaH (DUF805 family)